MNTVENVDLRAGADYSWIGYTEVNFEKGQETDRSQTKSTEPDVNTL